MCPDGVGDPARGTERGWQPGDPCGVCGSTNTQWGEPWQGAVCLNCGASDSDE